MHCQTQAEVDAFWDRLSADWAEQQCAWLKDKYGSSWQIVPEVLMELLRDRDCEKSKRVMQAMLQMKKIDIAALRGAAEGA